MGLLKFRNEIKILGYTLLSICFASWLNYYTIKKPLLYTISLFLTLLFLIVLIVVISSSKLIIDYFSNLRYKRKLKKPVIAILHENNCESERTKFSPNDWYNHFADKGYKTKYIRANEIDEKFTLIINPYGEVYPEQDLVNLTTLKRIKDYIELGGIFINAGGFPFYYGWHTQHKKKQVLPKEMQTYKLEPGGILQPIILQGYTSLIDTPLFDYFRVLTTSTPDEVVKVSQNQHDKKLAGDLTNSKDDEVVEFRAIREPAPHCFPLLRSCSNKNVYPIACIKSKKGYLISAGINLNSDKGDKFNQTQFEKVTKSAINFIKYLKNCSNTSDK